MVTASDIFAISQGSRNQGDDICHWCGSPCRRLIPHDDTPYLPFTVHRQPAKHPGHGFVCWGCWMWRRKRQTIHFFSGSYLDGKCAEDYSWLITERGSFALRPTDYPALLDFLR